MRRTRIWSEISVLVPPPLVSRSEWRFDLKYSYLASKIGIVFWRFSVRTTQIWSQVSDYLPLLSLRVRSEGFIQQHSYLASEIGICGCFGAWIRNLSRIWIECSLLSLRFENEIKPEILICFIKICYWSGGYTTSLKIFMSYGFLSFIIMIIDTKIARFYCERLNL